MSLLTPLLPASSLSDNLILYSSGSIPIVAKELNLKQTLLGGQSFRWFEQAPNEFVGVLGPYIVRLQHHNDNLRFTFCTDNIKGEYCIDSINDNDRRVETALVLHNYFQLTVNLADLFEKWRKVDARFDNGKVPMGVRVLAQEPLENLISFICSSNNNVQRISKMVKALCNKYGKKIGTLDGIDYHQFPTLDELDKPDLEKHLRDLHFGYRARYIQEAIKFVKYTAGGMGFFDRLKILPVKEARSQLLRIMGVGRKVADCVLLMSLGKQDVVPVDTHMHSIAVTFYGQESGYTKNKQMTTANYDDISSFFEKLWQPLAGWAQAAAFSNELRLLPSPRNSIEPPLPSLKRLISSNESLFEDSITQKILKSIDDDTEQTVIVKRSYSRKKKIITVEQEQFKEPSARPRRNIKPVDRY